MEIIFPKRTGYINTYSINLLAGKNFPFGKDASRGKALINEAALQKLGLSSANEAIGKYLSASGKRKTQIIGVIKNFNQESLRSKIEPAIYFYRHPFNFGTYSVLLQQNSFQNAIAEIQALWGKEYPNAPFNYQFVDSQLDSLYKSEKRFGQLLVLFAFLTIVIAALGLVGLIVIVTRKKTKEIGVRKVNGAKVSEIMALLYKDFIKWVTIAFIVACPIGYFAMNKWLENFAYKTTLSWWIFVLSGLIALVIVLFTVSWRTYKAATRNPIEALQYE